MREKHAVTIGRGLALALSIGVLMMVFGPRNGDFAGANEFAGLSGLSADARLEAVERIPLGERVAFMGRLSPGERAEVWAMHLDRWLSSSDDLTAEQTDLLKRARALAVTSTYEKDPAQLERVRALCRDATRIFPEPELRRAALAVIGARPSDRGLAHSHSGSGLPRFWFGNLNFAATVHADEFICNCDTNDLGGCQCAAYPGCTCWSGSCTNIGGCGCIGALDCNGFCGCCGGGCPIDD